MFSSWAEQQHRKTGWARTSHSDRKSKTGNRKRINHCSSATVVFQYLVEKQTVCANSNLLAACLVSPPERHAIKAWTEVSFVLSQTKTSCFSGRTPWLCRLVWCWGDGLAWGWGCTQWGSTSLSLWLTSRGSCLPFLVLSWICAVEFDWIQSNWRLLLLSCVLFFPQHRISQKMNLVRLGTTEFWQLMMFLYQNCFPLWWTKRPVL